MKKKRIIWISIVVVLALLGMTVSYLNAISCTVVDAATGKPIEGAVVLVEWTITRGLGLTNTGSYKVVEAFTKQNGNIFVMGVINPFVNSPRVTVYKKGYIAWNNEYAFPDYKKKENANLSGMKDIVIQLNQFDENKYKHSDHMLFIHGSMNYGLPGNNKKLMEEAIRSEDLKALEERLKKK